MSDMTRIFPMRSHNIGFALDWRVLARRLAYEFDECEATYQAEKITRPDQKKGG